MNRVRLPTYCRWVTDSSALLAAASGLGLGLSLIVAIGAQNAFVLRQGLRGDQVAPVVAVCAASDAFLIAAGVLGAGAVLSRWLWLVVAVRGVGAVFLFGYGALAARRAWRPATLRVEANAVRTSLSRTVLTCLALTWLNPHVYLDTVVLLGSIASTHGRDRWWFGAGAATGSVAWFIALGYGAALLRPVFTRPAAWRLLDAAIAVVMLTIATSLLLPLLP